MPSRRQLFYALLALLPGRKGSFYKGDCPQCGVQNTFYTYHDHFHCFSCGAHGATNEPFP
jgi:hypothetical protein